jgi:hypothetical protein
VRHPRRPHQPGASPRDPARLALISRRNPAVTTNAPIHALRQDQRNRTEYEPSPVPDPQSAWQEMVLTKSPPTPAPTWSRYHRDQAKLAIPIDHRHSPAGSCMGGFRTPAHASTSDLRWPASENLHHSRHPAFKVGCSTVDNSLSARFGAANVGTAVRALQVQGCKTAWALTKAYAV